MNRNHYTMTLNDLINTLTEIRDEVAAQCDVDAEQAGQIRVAIAHQPHYPLRADLQMVTAVRDMELGDEPSAYLLYLAAGGAGDYAPSAAWDGGVVDAEVEDA